MTKKKSGRHVRTGRQKSPPRTRKRHSPETDDSEFDAPEMIHMPADPRAIERTTFDLTRLIKDQNIETEDHLNSLMKRVSGTANPRSLFKSHKPTPLEQAQELVYQAFESPTETQRIALAKQALTLSEDCADAYVILAEHCRTPGEARPYYEKAVAAGERAIGAENFKEYEGHFWGHIETRPYMRAREGLAAVLWVLGERPEAVEHYRDMLRLNPGDNQGIRYMLLRSLLWLGDTDAAAKLLDQDEYKDDGMAEWLYSRALVAFRQQGATDAAVAALRQAFEQNPHVPPYLIGKKRLPRALPPYMGWGDEAEAQHYAVDAGRVWLSDMPALTWLKREFNALPPGALTRKPPR